MPHVFSDSPGKRIVRVQWDTPLLRYLHNSRGFRYRYFGLPGPDIIDVTLWRDMIEEVVAFEVPANGKRERANIEKLRRNLELLGIPNTTYYGSFEEVVLLRKDFDGQKYSQDKVITLYNLDFCSEIGSKIRTPTGPLQRLEAIRQVIRDQIECFNRTQEPQCFIILLTVRNQMKSGDLRERLLSCHDLFGAFINQNEAINPLTDQEWLIGTHAWALKVVIHKIFNMSLGGNNISSFFFPLVKYEGTHVRTEKGFLPSPMLHLMIFCRFQPANQVAGTTYPADSLRVKSLSVEDETLIVAAEPGEDLDPGLFSDEYFRAEGERFF